jgi:hypothetical protein
LCGRCLPIGARSHRQQTSPAAASDTSTSPHSPKQQGDVAESTCCKCMF